MSNKSFIYFFILCDNVRNNQQIIVSNIAINIVQKAWNTDNRDYVRTYSNKTLGYPDGIVYKYIVIHVMRNISFTGIIFQAP